MSIKEIITYVLGFAGLILMCYVRMQFTKRQQTQPDNAYTKKEARASFYAFITFL